MNNRLPCRKGAALPVALIFFFICAAASIVIIAGHSVSAYRSAMINEYERQYISASSAARLIRSSMTDDENMNVLMAICLQLANVKDGVSKMEMEAEGLPPAVCTITIDEELKMTTLVRSGNVFLKLTLPPAEPGIPRWNIEDAFIEKMRGEVSDGG